MQQQYTFNTVTFNVCADVADIVSQGYTDSIEDTAQHQATCNYVDNDMLPAGYYWLDAIDHDGDDFVRCEHCGLMTDRYTVTAMQRVPVPSNARFEYRGATLTLQPGQSLSHSHGGPTDEGYSYSAVTFTLSDDGEVLRAEHANESRDCDGRYSNGATMFKYLTGDKVGTGWHSEDEYMRDYTAEAAGY